MTILPVSKTAKLRPKSSSRALVGAGISGPADPSVDAPAVAGLVEGVAAVQREVRAAEREAVAVVEVLAGDAPAPLGDDVRRGPHLGGRADGDDVVHQEGEEVADERGVGLDVRVDQAEQLAVVAALADRARAPRRGR